MQVFYADVAKVDRDVAYVAMAIYVCFSVGSKCFICSRRMLQVFHLDVAKVNLGVAYICKCFKCFSNICCKCFYLDVCNGYTHGFKFFLVFHKCFRRMLQVF